MLSIFKRARIFLPKDIFTDLEKIRENVREKRMCKNQTNGGAWDSDFRFRTRVSAGVWWAPETFGTFSVVDTALNWDPLFTHSLQWVQMKASFLVLTVGMITLVTMGQGTHSESCMWASSWVELVRWRPRAPWGTCREWRACSVTIQAYPAPA